MNLIKQNYKILEQSDGLMGIYNHIELCGRTCYKSEDKIGTLNSGEFTQRMINSGHGAMLEHGTIYLYFNSRDLGEAFSNNLYIKYKENKYSFVKTRRVKNNVNNTYIIHYYITTNYRVIVENKWYWDLELLSDITEHHERRITVRFTIDRGITHEAVRHRVFSFAQESTRYCDYIKDRFQGTITFIKPVWLTEEEKQEFEEDLKIIESIYFKWRNKGWSPQKARGFLPHFVKSDLIMTGTISDWIHFFELRTDKAAHPQMVEIVTLLKEDFIRKGYLEYGK